MPSAVVVICPYVTLPKKDGPGDIEKAAWRGPRDKDKIPNFVEPIQSIFYCKIYNTAFLLVLE